MRRIILAAAMLLAAHASQARQPERESYYDPARAEWFRDARFGMFIHFGLYSMLGGSYGGHTLPDPSLPNGKSWYAEWVQMRLEVPSDEYKALAGEFNPVNFDADRWIEEARNAGMRYFVITAKHHDGFALWDTQVSDFKATNTPFGRDLLAELVAACRRHGMKYGFYYSHWHDWEYPGGALPHWFDRVPDAEFEKYWREKSLPQITELITMFDPDLLWFDTWDEVSHITAERRDELIALVRTLSPKCLINGRISYYDPGDEIDFLEMHDNEYPASVLGRPWQTPATMTHSWGWHAGDYNWKSSARMTGYLVHNASMGGNYLLNIGPKPDGSFPAPAVRRLREIGAWMLVNGEAVYNTGMVDMEAPENVYLTQKHDGGIHYLYISVTKPMEAVELPADVSDFGECVVLESGMPLKITGDSHRTAIELPLSLFRDSSVQVLRATITHTP
jgi:alpha-L-fucosidase